MSDNKELIQAIITIPIQTTTVIGLIWAFLHFRYSQNLRASIEIFVYFCLAGLLASIIALMF
jgi:hypothetical protein